MKPITEQSLHDLELLDDQVMLAAAVASSFDPFELFGTESLVDDERVELIDGLAAVCDEVDVGAPYRHWASTLARVGPPTLSTAPAQRSFWKGLPGPDNSLRSIKSAAPSSCR